MLPTNAAAGGAAILVATALGLGTAPGHAGAESPSPETGLGEAVNATADSVRALSTGVERDEPGSAGRNGRLHVRLVPHLGLYSPLSHLGDVWDGGRPVLSAGRRSGSVMVGAGLEVGGSDGGSSVRGRFLYGMPSEVPVTGPACGGCTVRGSLLTASVSTAYRPLSPLDRVQPHFVLGAGLKRYSFDLHGNPVSDGRALLRDQTQLAVEVGMGADFTLMGLTVQGEVTGFVSQFQTEEGEELRVDDAPIQSDLLVTLAVPLTF